MKQTVFVAALLFGSLSATAQPNWSALSEHLGKRVTVETPDRQLTGDLLRVEDARIVLQQAGGPVPIPRPKVRRVTRHRSRNKAGWIIGMGAAGFGLGFAIGFRAFDDATYAERKITATALAGAGAGALAGYAISRGGGREEVIYQTP
jgi:hypothetical protein